MTVTNISAKDFLSQAYRIDQRIDSKLGQVQSLRDLAEKAFATISDTPPSGTWNFHCMEDFITKAVDLESEIYADLQKLINLKREVTTIIKRIESPELQTLLELRYLCFMTWEEISVSLRLDIRWIHRLHIKALSEIDKIRH